MAKPLLQLALALLQLLLVACAAQPAPTPTQPPSPNPTTQITASTAVAAAINSFGVSRLKLVGEQPRVVSAKQMPLYAAHTIIRQRVSGPTTTAIETQPVWLVILESDYQITPPVPNATALPIQHGCIFTILDADGSYRQSTAGIPCPQ